MNNFIAHLKKGLNNKTIATIVLIVVCFFAFNLGNLLNKALTSITSIFSDNNQEVKEVIFQSDGYDSNVDGSFKITKQIDWISKKEVEMTFTTNTLAAINSINKDIILVLDTSETMKGNLLDKAKVNINNFIEKLFLNSGNKISIVTYNDTASILTKFTDKKDIVLELVNNIEAAGGRNYNQALAKVEEIMQDYIIDSSRDVEVLFLSSGNTTLENPNQVATYRQIKTLYPKIRIHGIQYEAVIGDINKISEEQYKATHNTLDKILIEAALVPEKYELFEVVEYVDDNYFNIVDYKTTVGDIDVEKNKITWHIDDYITGRTYQLKIKLELKEEYQNIDISKETEEKIYPTSKENIIKVKLYEEEALLSTTSDLTKLKSYYKVIYEPNFPQVCDDNLTLVDNKYPYETIKISEEKFECSGYKFKGYEEVNDLLRISDEAFIMPSNDVILRGIWEKVEIVKTMDGNVFSSTLYNAISSKSKLDTNIDFSKISSDVNGKGVYTIEDTIDEEYPIHYYRGDVDDNHVIFGGFCWNIVRTTSTGGIKLIYDGLVKNGACNNTGDDTQIGTLAFNTSDDDPKYVGYTYDANTNSVVKEYIENWYGNNLIKYTEYLEDTEWCNDKKIYNTSGSAIYYDPYNRIVINKNPSLSCSQDFDKYTAIKSSGNGLLKYPVGLITVDEAVYAGGFYDVENKNYYLYTGNEYWTMSPSNFVEGKAHMWNINSNGSLNFNDVVKDLQGVRPSISLKSEIKYSKGNGSAKNPYIIKIEP